MLPSSSVLSLDGAEVADLDDGRFVRGSLGVWSDCSETCAQICAGGAWRRWLEWYVVVSQFGTWGSMGGGGSCCSSRTSVLG